MDFFPVPSYPLPTLAIVLLSQTLSSLLHLRPRFALILLHGMQHNLVGQLRRIDGVALAPIVTDGVGKNIAGAVEGRGGDGAAYFRVALEPVLGVLVPEMERAIAAGCAEGTVDGVEGDGVDGKYVGHVALCGRGLSVAFE